MPALTRQRLVPARRERRARGSQHPRAARTSRPPVLAATRPCATRSSSSSSLRQSSAPRSVLRGAAQCWQASSRSAASRCTLGCTQAQGPAASGPHPGLPAQPGGLTARAPPGGTAASSGTQSAARRRGPRGGVGWEHARVGGAGPPGAARSAAGAPSPNHLEPGPPTELCVGRRSACTSRTTLLSGSATQSMGRALWWLVNLRAWRRRVGRVDGWRERDGRGCCGWRARGGLRARWLEPPPRALHRGRSDRPQPTDGQPACASLGAAGLAHS